MKEKSNESIMDQPNGQVLCGEIWTLNNNTYTLRPEVREKINAILTYMIEKFDITDYSVNITGSITSNSYSRDSDIDIHISSPAITEENKDEMNKKLRAEYEEVFKDSFSGVDKIGSHPIELYFQPNPIQDYMSVGCYDFKNDKWLVGPDFKDINFDPYSEYYDDDMEYVQNIIGQIRNLILEVHEKMIVVAKCKDLEFRNKQIQELLVKMQEAADIFDSMRKMRTNYSSPKSIEDAKRNRESKKWKTADSAFKLMDIFGYLPTLKAMKVELGNIKENPECLDAAIERLEERFKLDCSADPILSHVNERYIPVLSENVGKTKIIFLDYDGVLRRITTTDNVEENRPDDDIVLIVKRLCSETGCKIVWSTSWKNYNKDDIRVFKGISYRNPMPELNRIFANQIYTEAPTTPVIIIKKDPENKIYPSMSKVKEIKQWLTENGNEISDFRIFDDVDYMSGGLLWHFKDKYIQTKPKEGITDEIVDNLIETWNHGISDTQEITEGGRMFKDEDGNLKCDRINQENVQATINDIYTRLLPLLNLKEKDTVILGSTGKKLPGSSSGDIDLGIDLNVLKRGGIKNIADFVEYVSRRVTKELGYDVAAAESLNLCSVRWPISNTDGKQEDKFVQLDLMPNESLEMLSWGMYSPAEKDSKYKGGVRNALLAAIAVSRIRSVLKTKNVRGVEVPILIERYSFDRQNGLYTLIKDYESKKITKRNPDGVNKTGKTVEGSKKHITNDPKEILKILFGKTVDPDKAKTITQVWNLFVDTDLYKNDETRVKICSSCIRAFEQYDFAYPKCFDFAVQTDDQEVNN